MTNKNKKGFTLIEMIVVIAIIGILSTMLLTSVQRIRKNSIDSRRKSNLENVRGAATMYYSAKSSWPDITGNWDPLITNLSGLGYISDEIKADEDSDGTSDYNVASCASPCAMTLCSACEGDGEGCTTLSPIGDSRNWYCINVK